MDTAYARHILEKTRENYDKMAEEFSDTRAHIWEDLAYLKKFVQNGDKVLDLGCGNGRLLELFSDKKINYTGADSSEKLVEIAKNRYENNTILSSGSQCSFVVGDALNLPFEDDVFDKIFSVAVFHHIPSKEFRLQFLREAKRVLKKDGFLIIMVWNLWQKKGIWRFVKFTFLKLVGLSRLDFGDVLVPWKKKTQRYFHSFTRRELKKVAVEAGFSIEEIGLLTRKAGHFNIYIIAKK